MIEILMQLVCVFGSISFMNLCVQQREEKSIGRMPISKNQFQRFNPSLSTSTSTDQSKSQTKGVAKCDHYDEKKVPRPGSAERERTSVGKKPTVEHTNTVTMSTKEKVDLAGPKSRTSSKADTTQIESVMKKAQDRSKEKLIKPLSKERTKLSSKERLQASRKFIRGSHHI
ncbi:hypothetical protein GCK32_020885 [Trichostrongylus colubriformis]|uniref:Uncharacterized protein n=1 Tax=Trichostrongylus colubriformis TaxID=6319 RepID=A0AAN8GDL1_TRICO